MNRLATFALGALVLLSACSESTPPAYGGPQTLADDGAACELGLECKSGVCLDGRCGLGAEGEGETGCVPNLQQDCMCLDTGHQGRQVCAADGASWSTCACGAEGEGEGAAEGEGEAKSPLK